MKRLSEIVATLPDEVPLSVVYEALPFPCSSLADPPITPEEARTAETTICRFHNGQHTHLNVDGRAYFCAVGRMYFRHQKEPSEGLKRLQYPKGM